MRGEGKGHLGPERSGVASLGISRGGRARVWSLGWLRPHIIWVLGASLSG